MQEVLENTAYDFWRLVWQESARVVVTLQAYHALQGEALNCNTVQTGAQDDCSYQWFKQSTNVFRRNVKFKCFDVRGALL